MNTAIHHSELPGLVQNFQAMRARCVRPSPPCVVMVRQGYNDMMYTKTNSLDHEKFKFDAKEFTGPRELPNMKKIASVNAHA